MISPEADAYIKYLTQKHLSINAVVYNRKQYLSTFNSGVAGNVQSTLNQDENVICVLITDLHIIPQAVNDAWLTDDNQTPFYKYILPVGANTNQRNINIIAFNYVAFGEVFSISSTDPTTQFSVGFITVSRGKP